MLLWLPENYACMKHSKKDVADFSDQLNKHVKMAKNNVTNTKDWGPEIQH